MAQLDTGASLAGAPGPVRLTRSWPHHKEDNAHVEQKNWMWPRQLLGYGRLEDPQLIIPINEVYQTLWGPLHNFFLPSMKLMNKQRVGARWKRKHEPPQTAYQRLLKMDVLNTRKKRELQDWYQSLDPFLLHEQLEQALRPILAKALEVN